MSPRSGLEEDISAEWPHFGVDDSLGAADWLIEVEPIRLAADRFAIVFKSKESYAEGLSASRVLKIWSLLGILLSVAMLSSRFWLAHTFPVYRE